MKLNELRNVIKEETEKAILERRLVRTEVRKAIKEALPKLGSGKRFKNLVKKISAQKEGIKEAEGDVSYDPAEYGKCKCHGLPVSKCPDAQKISKESKGMVREGGLANFKGKQAKPFGSKSKNNSKKTVKEGKKTVKESKKPIKEDAKVRMLRRRVHETIRGEIRRALSERAKIKEGAVRDPSAVAAAIGRKKYGNKKFQAMAAAGRRKKS